MSAKLRIHRGPASQERELLLGPHHLGKLTEEVTEFDIPPGRHMVSLALGFEHSVATHIEARDGEVVDLRVEENPEAVLPLVQGGFLRFHRDEARLSGRPG